KVGLRWIFPLRSLRYMQTPVLGLSGNSIIRYNLSYYMQKADNDPFAFDKNDFLKDDIRALIHHEFMHIIDQRYNATWKKDTNWMALQNDDNHFGDGGVSTIKFGAANLTQFNNPQPGFVNLYGMSSPGEDKATLFECFRVQRYAALLGDWQKQDPILGSKVANLKKFFKKVDPRFDEEFWIRFQEYPEDKKPEARAR
ncbi:MAG: hypothetical protein JNM63_09165, partial [Spirochaetia bacterium]|nr:hypothetical protein [Spirochaetia bacterium]